VADVLRAIHRRRIVLLHPRARSKNPSPAIHDSAHARPANPAAVRRDVLLAMESPPPSPVTSARPTRSHAPRYSRGVTDRDTGRFVKGFPRLGKRGYVEVKAFNAEPYAHHWFEKTLGKKTQTGRVQ